MSDDQHALLSPQRWQRRAAMWTGAVVVALAAIAFAKGAELCYALFVRLLGQSRAWPFVVTPLGFALLAWLTQGRLKATRGSGIPQVIAALEREDDAPFRTRLLSLPVAIAKMLLTLFAMLVGASVGREGPTVHTGAGLMAWLAQRLGLNDAKSVSHFALAGGAAGIAAAFNAPLAGIVFAIEELAGTFEHRFSGALLTTVMISGIVSLWLLGDYAYFGAMSTSLPIGEGWIAVLVTGILGGLAGGLFARAILWVSSGSGVGAGAWRLRSPVLFAGLCGLAMAAIGYASGDAVYGTGYAQVRALIEGHPAISPWFAIDKWLANFASYAAGIPGGIFSPALAVGAGMGAILAPWLPHTAPSAAILLGMSAYLAGVTQAPLTSAVITMELTDNHEFVLPILAACLLGRTFSTLLCKTPVYRAFARRAVEARERELATAAGGFG